MSTRTNDAPITLIAPGDAEYELLRSTYTTVGSPAVVALPRSPAEVAAALRTARERELPVAVRSGGHGLSGSGTNNGGLVIDLRALDRIDVLDRAAGLVRVEAGARWAEVARALAPHGLAISSGDHGNVGVGGLATGGGVGWLVRHYGLTIDRIRAVEIVLPDGSFVRADAGHEPDLFWLMRGAGAGAGIATAFEIEAAEIGQVGLVHLTTAVDPAGETLRQWEAAVAAAPRALSTAVTLTSRGPAATTAFITAVVASDDPDLVRDSVTPLLDIGRAQVHEARLVPYSAMVPLAHLHPNTGQMPSHTTNGLLTEMSPDAARSLVVAASGPRPALVQLRSLGGAVGDVDPEETAFAHRHQRTLVVASMFPPADRADLTAAWEPVAAHSDGAYVNFESAPDDLTRAQAYPGRTGTRVEQLLRRYDPDGVLSPGGTQDT
ncbi:FAD-dependent oxidoreductase [Streptomyces sp. NPDC013178]|uniref:FAD-binding oxidoreductase n=1 Tax=Streptomyces sp. NPDC013178 TaxID=3155118 RepID=UPI0033F12399